jgi:hypothetical protein
LIGGAGALFTLGLIVVAVGSVAAATLEHRRAARRERAEDTRPGIRSSADRKVIDRDEETR